MYYTGHDFESAKEYKTLDGAKKAADKNGMNVYDEDAVQIYPDPSRIQRENSRRKRRQRPAKPHRSRKAASSRRRPTKSLQRNRKSRSRSRTGSKKKA